MLLREGRIRILVINPYGIGDVLFTTGRARPKETVSAAFIGCWCNERAQPVRRSNPRIDKVFPMSRGDLRAAFRRSPPRGRRAACAFFSSIKKERSRVLYSPGHRYGPAALFCGIPRRVGHDHRKQGALLADRRDPTGYGRTHMFEYHAGLFPGAKARAGSPARGLPQEEGMPASHQCEEAFNAADVLLKKGGKLEERTCL